MPSIIQQKVNKLIEDFYKRSNDLLYSNLNQDKKYAGWVSDFHLKYMKNDEKVFLDLKKENDMFLLFVLAIAWSRSGHWENAPYLVSYIKHSKNDNIEYWTDNNNIKREMQNRANNANNVTDFVYGITPRKNISFREDIFCSINILANKWLEINKKLIDCQKSNKYIDFMEYLHSINGLGYQNKKLFIKIPLILRELRCQNIFNNIPGDICCVYDARVKDACIKIGIDMPTRSNSINFLIRSSKIIYDYFGDLYDIPLFAYKDIYGE
jgi:hypothetical protein